MGSFGNNLKTSVYGESHGAGVGVLIDGMPAGLAVDEALIADALKKRVSYCAAISTTRRETDFVIQSGVYNGFTTGTSLCIFLPNIDVDDRPYKGVARPGHADYTEFVRSDGYCDLRGGGYHSGRLTAALVAAGAIVLPALKLQNIKIASHIATLGGIEDAEMTADSTLCDDFPTVSRECGVKMRAYIADVKSKGDSCGGVCQTKIFGLPAGLGGGYFDSADGLISFGLMSLPAVKSVSFGNDIASLLGSAANDKLYAKNNKVYTKTNNCGGIVGGITNGSDVVVNVSIKPVASIAKPMDTVTLPDLEPISVVTDGRHDPCAAHRIIPALDAVCALAVADLMIGRYGRDCLAAKVKRL